jgi:acetylornithine aminotransferase
MELFDVYPRFDIAPATARGCWVTDTRGDRYLDLYGGHAVISIGHSHPKYIKNLCGQLGRIAFYSNAVQNPLQEELAARLGRASDLDSYQLFLCNSGAEANENALKLASFHTGKSRVVAFKNSFHGRTSAAVAATDNPAIISKLNALHQVSFLPLNDLEALEKALMAGDVSSVILEPIQGVGGLGTAETSFLEGTAALCQRYGAVFIADEVQSGFGRTGKFFAFQHSRAIPGIVTMAKGMGNGFPVGGILIHPDIRPRPGMLGTTFGGNHLACTAALTVLEVLEEEGLIAKATERERQFRQWMAGIPGIKHILGKGLMLGLELEREAGGLRKALLEKHRIFTGSSSNKNQVRILPPLSIEEEELLLLPKALKTEVI